ncbi:MAG: hypothetical protein HZC28_04610 [Spirochaetes bacterium]|nr:hypothetical protein [Spirochaetota bacterium]
MKLNGPLVFILIVIAGGIGVLGFFVLTRAPNATDKNPYPYDMSALRTTNAKQYREIRSIDVSSSAHAVTIAQQMLYVLSDDGVAVYSRAGEKTRVFPVQGATAIAVDGDIFLGMGDRIAVYSSAGEFKSQWREPDRKTKITALAVQGDAVAAVDFGCRVVWHYSRAGTLRGIFGRRDEEKRVPGLLFPSPYGGVAMSPSGIWVANTGRLSMERYGTDGRITASWGHPGMTIDGFTGCCNPVHFAMLPAGFVTSEKGLLRIKTYDLRGTFTALVAGPEDFHPATKPCDVAADAAGDIYVLDSYRHAVRVFTYQETNNAGSSR